MIRFLKSIIEKKVFAAYILCIFVLTTIQPAYAVWVDDNSIDSPTDHPFLNLSRESSFSSNELLVQVKFSSKDHIKNSQEPEDTGIYSLNALNKEYGVLKFEHVVKQGAGSKKDSPLFRWYKLTLNTQEKKITKNSEEFKQFEKIMNSYKLDPTFENVEPDYFINVLLTPNDPYFASSGSWNQSYPDLWGIRKINSSYAWDQTTGLPSVIVANIDTGVDRNHDDLKGNMWVNYAEIPENGIDDDKNGYVDDYYGWDWVNNDNDPMDDNGHGTHTAGTISATGNNGIGVVGVNWNSRIMTLKFLNSGGSGYLSDAVKAMQYAADNGARVSSNSWGSSGTSTMLDEAIQYEHDSGMVVVVAAGNSNSDARDFTPASADLAITVAASDYTDARASFSNWGQKIDVAAPGVNILSTRASINPMCTAARTVGTNYCLVSGTSMATPHVAGLAALILAKDPSLTNEEVRQIIRTGAIDLGTPGKDRDFGYGRIDAGSISLSDIKPLSPIITSPRSRTVVYGQSLEIKGGITGPDFDIYILQAGSGRDPAVWIPLYNSTTQVTNGTLAVVDTTQVPDGQYIFRLTAIDKDGKSYQFQIHDIEVDNFDADISFPVALVSQGNVDVTGTAKTKNGLPFSHYTLEWGIGSSPNSYSTEGIALMNNGLQPVSGGELAEWNTSGLTPGQVYTLRLSVTSDSGITSLNPIAVTLDKDLVKGWPKLINRGTRCAICEATPTVVDLDNDGAGEVIITSPDNKIYVFRKDGTDFPGFPVSVITDEFFTWPANVADLDNDSYKEIVAASVTSAGTSKVYILRSNGTFYPGWPQPVHVIGQQSGDGTPTITDLNGDGRKDLVIIDPYNKKMHAYQLDGTELAGFPKILPLSDLEYPGAPSITDLDNDGVPEIAYGLKNKFYLFDNQGNVIPGWPFVAPVYNGNIINFRSSAASGDIDGDGYLEIVAIGHNGGATSPLYALKMDGSVLPQWPMAAGYLSYGHSPLNSPSLTDVDSDGKDEAVVGLSSLSIFDLEGQKSIGTGIGAKIAPGISDVDGDGRFEFAGIRDNKVQIGMEDGSLFWERAFSTDAHFVSPGIFTDLDNNGRIEFAVVQGRFPNEPGNLLAYLWEFQDVSAQSSNNWPMFLHDPKRSGRIIPLSIPPDTISPSTSIINPPNAATVSDVIEVTADASDNSGVGKVEFYKNNVLVGTDTSSPFVFNWDTTQEQNGIYTLQSKAYDTADNVGISQAIAVTVNNNIDPGDAVAPVVMITYPLNNYVQKKSTVTITASASDNVGVTKVDFTVNGILVCTDTTANYTCNWKVPAKPGRQYMIQIKAYDARGNIGYSKTVEVISK
ncbi:Thermophilic serine proteinase [Methanosarcinales archaeon]|nr:Thermophilic serine proteinase [Methanosarcinales archaeon]